MSQTAAVTFLETLPTNRCDCGQPAEWAVEVREHDPSREPPYRFWTDYYCDVHLPPEARKVIAPWS